MVAITVCLAIVAAHLIPAVAGDAILIKLRHALHFAGFAALAAMMQLALRKTSAKVRILAIVGLGVLTALAAELAQFASGFRFDLTDIGRDLAGLFLGLIGGGVMIRPMSIGLRATVTVAIAAGILAPVAIWGLAWWQAERQAGVVLGSQWWARHAASELGGSKISTGLTTINVELAASGYSGIETFVRHRDWSAAEFLVINAISANGVTRITVRIDDVPAGSKYDSRFNESFDLSGQYQTLRIPIETIRTQPPARDLNTSDIHRIYLFTSDAGAGASLSLAGISLE